MFDSANILRALAALALLWSATPGRAAPLLINAQQATFRTRPDYIRDHFAHIDTLPFDGMVISTLTSRQMMTDNVRTYAQMAADFAPLDGLRFTRMQHNLALVNVDRPADFFGDWSAAIENFRTLARVLKERGLAGISFDNEEYWSAQYNYPDDCADQAKSLAAYSAQARLRGRQIMEAIAGEFPDIVFLVFFGPYTSHPGTPNDVRRGGSWTEQELRGPFTVGLMEGADSRTRVVDGGEVYAYRTEADFQGSYDFRKFTLASAAQNCAFIPPALRSVWAQKLSISFGVYNLPVSAPMDPAIMRPTLERALRRCDDFVWLYFEEENWNAPGEISQDWVDAVVGAQAATQAPPASAAPSVSITSPATGLRFTTPRTIAIAANASSADGSVSKVEFFRDTTKLGESLSPPYHFAWSSPAAGTYALTAKVTDSSGVTTTSSAATVTIGAAFAANINFQPAGGTPPVGYFADTGETYGSRENGLTYGWNISHTTYACDREDRVDRRLATLGQFRAGGVWQIAVPDGIYAVTVGIGDGKYASTYTVNTEGVNCWTAHYLAAGEFVTQTRTVIVSDGNLTIDQGSAPDAATRIDYLLIAAAGTPPAEPGGLCACAVSPGIIALQWADHSCNETGFTLQRSTSADFSTALQTLSLAADQTSHTDSGLTSATTYYYRLRSINAAGPSRFSNTPAATTPILDTDGDGIPDPQESPPSVVGVDDRQADSDGDGLSNAAEFHAGTDPLDSHSRPQVTATSAGFPGTTVSLFFPTVAGRKYALDFTDSLTGGIWTLVPGSARTGDGTLQTVLDTSSSAARFFRLRVSP